MGGRGGFWCFRVVMTLNITSMSSPMSSLRIAAYFHREFVDVWMCIHVSERERTRTCLTSKRAQEGVRVRGVHERCKCAGTQSPHQGCERRVAVRAIARV